ncbi:MAG: pentapeptide repeat-containing protein [Pleurocapsa minor HA4230-MV1]|nr:pentapeptide repeat-containing protein [Pleurocapsa minor HA4230-MV1]
MLRLYAGGEKDLTGKSFRGTRWRDRIARGGIYRETNFSGAYFDSSHFIGVDLSFAIFNRVRMYESTIGNSYMEGADFSDAIFGQATFYDVDLSRAIFRNAVFEEAGFKNANLSYADLRGATGLTTYECKNVIFHETIMPNGAVYTGRT